MQFFQNGLLALKNRQRDVYFNLPTNKKKFLTVPFGEEAYDIVASYCQTDAGIETYKLLKRHLKGESPQFEVVNEMQEVKIESEPKRKKRFQKSNMKERFKKRFFLLSLPYGKIFILD